MDETEKEQQLYNEFQMWNNDVGIVNDFDNDHFLYRLSYKETSKHLQTFCNIKETRRKIDRSYRVKMLKDRLIL